KDGRLWLTGVRSDLEALGYAVGAADLCAAGVGAPHIRQRLYWLADANSRQRERVTAPEGCYDDREASGRPQGDSQSQHGCSSGGQGDGAARGMGNADSTGSQAGRQAAATDGHGRSTVADGGARGLGDADDARSQERRVRFDEQYGEKG